MSQTNSDVRTQVADPADLGAIIRQRRTTSGLTQSEMAKALGVHRRYVYELERGGPDARLQRTLAALDMLGVRVQLEVGGGPVHLPKKKGRATAERGAATGLSQQTSQGASEPADQDRRGWLRWGRRR